MLRFMATSRSENGYGFKRPGLKTSVENDFFLSEIGSGFGEPCNTHTKRIPRSTPQGSEFPDPPPPPCPFHKMYRLLGNRRSQATLVIIAYSRRYVIVRVGFIVLVHIQIWCISLHDHLQFFYQLEETGTKIWVFPPTFCYQMISVVDN